MEQHMQALANANRVRLARADLKRQIRTGQVTVADVLRDLPGEARTMTIGDLIDTQKGWGSHRTNRLLRSVPISPMRQVGNMTARERDLISYRVGMTPAEYRAAA